jgi:hypothetical protein
VISRTLRTRFQGCEKDCAIQLVASVFPLEKREFCVITMPQFTTASSPNYRSVGLAQNRPYLRVDLAISPGFGHGLAHNLNGLYHKLSCIHFLLIGHAFLRI